MNILTKIIKTGKAEILVLGGLPQDSINIAIWERDDEMSIHDLRYQRSADNKKELVRINLPLGKWRLVNRLRDVTEEQAEEIMEYNSFIGVFIFFKDTVPSFHRKAKEALLSLIESEVKMKNKYGENTPKPDMFGSFSRHKEVFEQWLAEEATIFRNPIIFVKQ